MVASAHNLDDPTAVAHPANGNGDRNQHQQQQQRGDEKHAGHIYRSAQQTAQDAKRSRLSNVINNLRKKVPDPRNGEPNEEDGNRNSVERNLETLEKYVMTVLNGVIKDEEENDEREVSRKKETDKKKEDDKLAAGHEDEEGPKGLAAKFEPSKPNESRTEAAVFLSEQPDNPKEFSLELRKVDTRGENSSTRGEEFPSVWKEKNQERNPLPDDNTCGKESSKVKRVEDGEEKNVCCIGGNKCSPPCKEIRSEEQQCVQECGGRNDNQEEERRENRSLGTIIMERLSESLSDGCNVVEGSLVDDAKHEEFDNVELRNVCRDLLNDLLNDINQLIDENRQEKREETNKPRLDGNEESKDSSRVQDFSMTSLHCSLPLDKVASVLQNCQTSELAAPQSPCSSSSSSQGSKSPSKPSSPTVRHLCLYCDRKFMSISLRQRHTERVHQQGGGRRSERNSRKPSQNCQYCSDKCAESLEGLFQHMIGSHGDKYHACLQCSTRYLTREALAVHMNENHGVNLAERNLQIQVIHHFLFFPFPSESLHPRNNNKFPFPIFVVSLAGEVEGILFPLQGARQPKSPR